MERISDEVLMEELKKRFEENAQALFNLRMLTQKLEALNEKLRQSEALKSDFLSNIRNEINNPLASILGMARQVADGRADPAAARQMALVIYHEAFDLDFQLQNIFTAAELEAGESSLGIARVDVAELLNNLAASYGHKAAEKQVQVEVACDGGSRPFTTDPGKLRLVLANLLANAIEFNRQGGRVQVRARCRDDRLMVSVADEGPGIPPEDQKKIFDRFVQLDSGSRKRHRGHGLGLSIVKALGDLLGGTVTVSSEGGAGCEFTVTLAEIRDPQGGAGAFPPGEGTIFDDGARF